MEDTDRFQRGRDIRINSTKSNNTLLNILPLIRQKANPLNNGVIDINVEAGIVKNMPVVPLSMCVRN